MGTHPIFESDFDCLTEKMKLISSILLLNAVNCMYFYLEPGTKKCIKEEAEKGKFAFTTDDQDMFEICFVSNKQGNGFSRDAKAHEIKIDVKKGIEAKNYDEQAKTEKLKPLEVELRRLEDLSDSIVNDFQYMKQREEEMRSTNVRTNSRVLYFSIFSMLCLVCLATWQVVYLRKFFKSKKLIE